MSVTIQAVTAPKTTDRGYQIEAIQPEKPEKSLPRNFREWHNCDLNTPDIKTESVKTESDALPRVLRTENQTRFKPEEAPPYDRRQMYRLRNHHLDINSDRVDVDQSSNIDISIKFHLMIALGDELAMPSWIVWRATRRLFTIDSRREGLPSDVLGFCIYAHLIDSETTDYEKKTPRLHNKPSPGKDRIYWPRQSEKNDPHFQRVADHLCNVYQNATESVIQSLLQRLQTGGIHKKESNYVPTESRVQQRMNNQKDRKWTPATFDNSQLSSD